MNENGVPPAAPFYHISTSVQLVTLTERSSRQWLVDCMHDMVSQFFQRLIPDLNIFLFEPLFESLFETGLQLSNPGAEYAIKIDSMCQAA